MDIKKGDTIKVLYGKDSGKTGVVLSVLRKIEKVLVAGVNKVTKHIKGDGKTRKSEIVVVERPMPISKVMLVCPNCNKPARLGRERKGSGYVRVCKKCGKVMERIEEKKDVKKEVVKKDVTKEKSKSKKKESKK